MKTSIARIACAALLGSVVSLPAAAANDPAEEKAVMAVLDTLVRATIDKDVATLEKVYHPDLMYSHTSGLTETKAQVLKTLTGAKNTVLSMTFDETTIRIYGTVALVKANTDLRQVRLGEEPRRTDLHILWVLVKGAHGWQVTARHPTRLAPQQP